MKTYKNSQTTTVKGNLSQSELERAIPNTNTCTAPQTPPLELIRNCRQLRRSIAAGFCDFRLMLRGGAYNLSFLEKRLRRSTTQNFFPMKKKNQSPTRLTVNAQDGQKAANTEKKYKATFEQIHFSAGHISFAAKSQGDAELFAKKIRSNEIAWRTTVLKINIISVKPE